MLQCRCSLFCMRKQSVHGIKGYHVPTVWPVGSLPDPHYTPICLHSSPYVPITGTKLPSTRAPCAYYMAFVCSCLHPGPHESVPSEPFSTHSSVHCPALICSMQCTFSGPSFAFANNAHCIVCPLHCLMSSCFVPDT